MAIRPAEHLRYHFGAPDNPGNDHLIFANGHASPLLYAMYKAAGPSRPELLSSRPVPTARLAHSWACPIVFGALPAARRANHYAGRGWSSPLRLNRRILQSAENTSDRLPPTSNLPRRPPNDLAVRSSDRGGSRWLGNPVGLAVPSLLEVLSPTAGVGAAWPETRPSLPVA